MPIRLISGRLAALFAATLFGATLLGATLFGDAASGDPAPEGAAPEGVVRVVETDLAPVVRELLGAQREKVARELALAEQFPGVAKTAVRMKGVKDPWGAMADLEQHGLTTARAARAGRRGLGPTLDAMAAAIGKPGGVPREVAAPAGSDLPALADWITAVLDAARADRDAAFEGLSEKERAFLVRWAPNVLVNYGPQAPLNARSKPVLERDAAFVRLMDKRVGWAGLLGAAHTLAAFAEPRFVQRVKAACFGARPAPGKQPGVTGKLLFKRQTPHGWILVGGKGKNTYALTEPVALIVDIGGNDIYRERVAASADLEHPFGVIVDLGGHDRYAGGKMQLAVGCGGVGLLCDLGGNDRYDLGEGTGGVGLAGIGILLDAAGHDTYTGSKFSQGAAIGGLGLLLDLAGNDTHTAFGYGVGFGGAGGVGAVIDLAGKDRYQCGGKYPSGYNDLEKVKPKPGDARFQWTAFGMGMGLGRRIIGTNDIREHRFALAGGIGMVLDAAGDDRYQSANFSQGCGYYFGAGLKLDLGGHDEHGAARYGHAAGAHFGMGLFVDYQGRDTYSSTGPTYNGGCAWDRSIFLLVDAGEEGDTYDLTRSLGLGRADIGSWGVFADLAGADTYRSRHRPGHATRTGVGVFYDRGGKDTYEIGAKPKPPKKEGARRKGKKKDKKKKKKKDREQKPAAKSGPTNGERRATEEGGLFWDRK